MSYSTILFDIDGTLCDPGPSIIESAQFALSELGVDEKDPEKLRRFVGPPLEHSFRDYYGFNEARTKQAVTLFRQKLLQDGIKLYTAYPGIPELLDKLQSSGKRLAIVTSKIDYLAQEALQATNLSQYFDIISSQRANEVVKKEELLGRALQQINPNNLSEVVMIGDRMHDVEAAKAHSIDSIGVLWGYGSLEELKEEGATHTARNTNELTALLFPERRA